MEQVLGADPYRHRGGRYLLERLPENIPSPEVTLSRHGPVSLTWKLTEPDAQRLWVLIDSEEIEVVKVYSHWERIHMTFSIKRGQDDLGARDDAEFDTIIHYILKQNLAQ